MRETKPLPPMRAARDTEANIRGVESMYICDEARRSIEETHTLLNQIAAQLGRSADYSE